MSVRLQLQNCQATGNVWGIPPEVPPSDEVTQACVRERQKKYARAATAVFNGRPSAAETAVDQEGKDWKGGG